MVVRNVLISSRHTCESNLVSSRHLPGVHELHCHLTCRKAFSEEDFDQFQMERGYCVVGGPAKYTPQLVRNTVMTQPNARRTVYLRALEITGRLGAFLVSLSVDKLLGRNNAKLTVQKRASQLR